MELESDVFWVARMLAWISIGVAVLVSHSLLETDWPFLWGAIAIGVSMFVIDRASGAQRFDPVHRTNDRAGR